MSFMPAAASTRLALAVAVLLAVGVVPFAGALRTVRATNIQLFGEWLNGYQKSMPTLDLYIQREFAAGVEAAFFEANRDTNVGLIDTRFEQHLVDLSPALSNQTLLLQVLSEALSDNTTSAILKPNGVIGDAILPSVNQISLPIIGATTVNNDFYTRAPLDTSCTCASRFPWTWP
jgi:hypothetical protein